MKKETQKGNAWGIVGVSIGWLIPIVGIIAGIISLNIKEDDRTIGIAAIVVSAVAWMIWFLLIIGGIFA